MPLIPKIKTLCDCISVYQPHSRWRFTYRSATFHQGNNLFAFSIWTTPQEQCAEVSFREGYCCDSTLDTIEVSLDHSLWGAEYWKAINYYWLLDTDNSVVQQGAVGTQQWTPLGLLFTGFKPKWTYDVPVGQEMVLVLSFNPDYWNTTETFPCGASRFVDEPNVCDYDLHGKQVRDGQLLEDSYGDSIAQCCPEGVWIQQPEEFCGCTDNKLDSPYRLSYRGPSPLNPLDNTVTHNLRVVAVQPEPYDLKVGTDCTAMDLDRVRIYLRPELAGFVYGATVGGRPAAFAYGDDGTNYWVELQELGLTYQPLGTVLDVGIQLAPSAPVTPGLCPANPLGTAECEYVFFGAWDLATLDYQCCAHGYSDPEVTLAAKAAGTDPRFANAQAYQPDAPTCDTNTHHTPYQLQHESTTYVKDLGTTSLRFRVSYDAATCDLLDPTNEGCCATDLKGIFLAVASKNVVGVATQPDGLNLAWKRVEGGAGLNVTGVFGTGQSFSIDVAVSGRVDLAALCQDGWTEDGCQYQLYGGSAFSAPGMCCPTYWTGLNKK